MTLYRAAWLLPIAAPPIADAWLAVEAGRIVAYGATRDGMLRAGGSAARVVDLGPVAVLPGLVNAHTHLELSYLRDAVAPASQFVDWVRAVVLARRSQPDPMAAEILEGIDRAVGECLACGTALVGDISNTLVTVAPLAASLLGGVVFYELLRFNAPDPEALVREARRTLDAQPTTARVRVSLAAHAPYSVSPLLFRAIRKAMDQDPFAPCSVHLAESTAEVEFLESGGGPWRTFLERVGAWDPAWVAPRVSPVQYLDDAGFLGDRVLAVHGVQMEEADLLRLVARGTCLVTCPRSNGHTGAGAPPLAEFYASGVRVAIGTDSLASAPDLNVFAELATMRALAPSVPAGRLLASATIEGARALGFDADHGTIEPGKRARLLTVNVSTGVDDVEEYLVSGIDPRQIGWIEE